MAPERVYPEFPPVDPQRWREVPCTQGRLATEEDMEAARAAFYFSAPKKLKARPGTQPVPTPAILRAGGGGTPVVVIQIELTAEGSYVGYRPLDGGVGVCSLDDVTLLSDIDARFTRRRSAD